MKSQKNDDIELMSCDIVEELFSFFISSLLSFNSVAMSFENEQQFVMFNLTKQSNQLHIKSYNDD
jgi:hypothetical protein